MANIYLLAAGAIAVASLVAGLGVAFANVLEAGDDDGKSDRLADITDEDRLDMLCEPLSMLPPE